MDTNELTFTQEELDRLTAAIDYIREFEEKVMTRFKLYAVTTLGFDVDQMVAQSGGYLSFRPRINKQLAKDGVIEVIETMASDRGVGTSKTHKMPVTSLFSVSTEEQDTAEYLRLKAKLGR